MDYTNITELKRCSLWISAGFFTLLLFGINPVVTAAPSWTGAILEEPWLTSYAACYHGDAQPLLELKRSEQPGSQWRIGTVTVDEYWLGVEAQCRVIIEKYQFFWITNTITEKILYRLGENDLCESPDAATGICFAKGDGCDTAGNPIVIASGAKRQVEVDYRGIGVNPLVWRRIYNHQRLQSTGLGMGWRHSYAHRVTFGTGTESAYLSRADGKVFHFTHSGGGVWSGDADVNGTLSRAADDTWSYRNAKDEVEHYNALGQLATITDRTGLITVLQYDANHRLQSVTDPAGRALSLAYDANDRIQTLTDPEANVFTYGYDINDNLITLTFTPVTWPGSGVQTIRTYQYQDANHLNALTGIIDENGGATPYATFSYDALGKAATSSHAGGVNHYAVTFNPDDTITVTDPLTTQRTYTFSDVQAVPKQSNLTQPCAACGQQWASTTYDANGNFDQRTDFNGHVTDYEYDLARNLETQRFEAKLTSEARTITTNWHPNYRLPTSIAEPGRLTAFTYDAATGNRLTKTITDTNTSESRTWIYEYTTVADGTLAGLLKSQNGPRDDLSDVLDKTTYTYYANGDLHTTTNALGHVTEYLSYNAHGQPLEIKDPNGIITQLTYYPRGWLASRTMAYGTSTVATTSFIYDDIGQLTRSTQPDGSYLEYAYDAAHRLTDIEDSIGNTIHYALDDMGNRIQEQSFDPLSSLKRNLQRTYNGLNRLEHLIGNDGQLTEYGYDIQGNQTSHIEAKGTAEERTTEYGFDALDRMVERIDPYNTVAKPTQYGYDALDQMNLVTDPESLATSYVVTALGDRKQINSPDTGQTNSGFDPAGNLINRTDADGRTATYTYDALNRLKNIDYPGEALDIAYTYDLGTYGIGQITGMEDASGNTIYAYDARGNLIQESRTILGVQHVTGYTYDDADQLLQIVYPSGRAVDSPRDSAGRINAVSTTFGSTTEPLAQNITYDPFGPATGFTYGNGLLRTTTFDLDGRVDMVQSGAAQNLSYDYNLFDQIIDLNDLVTAGLNQQLDYDDLDRLASANGGYGTFSYTYDGVGNRQSLNSPAGTDTYSYTLGSHQLETITGSNTDTRSYDGAGNTTALDGFTLSYGDHNRLSTVLQGALLLTSYTHDGQGHRIIKQTGSDTTVYHYDQTGKLIAESDGSGNTQTEYIYLQDQPLAAILPESSVTSQCSGSDPVLIGKSVLAEETYYCQASASITVGDDGFEVNDSGIAVLQAPTVELRPGTHILEGGQLMVGASATPPAIGVLYFIHPDHLGTPRVMTDAAQVVTWQWDSTPFAKNTPDEDPDGDGHALILNLRFPGQYYDSETGLHYNYFRTYDPSTGRYLESDPIGLTGGLNTYLYVGGNPLFYSDPLGLAEFRPIDPLPRPYGGKCIVIEQNVIGVCVSRIGDSCGGVHSAYVPLVKCKFRCEYFVGNNQYIYTLEVTSCVKKNPLKLCESLMPSPYGI